MAWPTTAVATGDLITAAQLNGLPVRIVDSTVAGSAVASVDLTSIPSVYAHLLVVAYLRGDNASTGVGARFRFNNDSAANYDYQYALAHGAVSAPAESLAAAYIDSSAGTTPAASAPANTFAMCQWLIPHYANATNHKTAKIASTGKLGTASGDIWVFDGVGFWRATAAINRLTIYPSAGNWDVGSRVTLYGLA